MFALVLFSDNVYYICKKANIIEGRGSCSIKYKDGKRYAGKIIACKEDYKELVTLKLKLENESNIENRKQLTYNRNIYKRKLQNALLEDKENLCTKNTDLKTVKKKIIKKKHIIAQDRHDRDELDINKDVSKVVEDGINGNIPEVSNNIVSTDRHGKDELDINRDVLSIAVDGINGNIPKVSNTIVSTDRHGKDELDINRHVSNIAEDGIDGNIPEVSNNIDIGQLLNLSLLNCDTNGDILILPYDLQTEQSTSGLVQNIDAVYCDNSLDDISFPARFNLRNIQEEEDEGNKSNITSNSKSSDSSYIPNSDASEESNIEDKRTSETSTKNGNKDLSKTSNNTTLETSIPLGHSAPDDTNMFVQSVGRGSKKDFCVYCRTEQTKLSRHLIRIHKDEKEVKEIIYLPKGQSKRRILINEIRKKGQYLFNTNSDINTGELKVMRRPNSEKNKNATDFSICPQCKGNYSKSALRHHYRRCTKKNSTNHRAILSKSRRISCRIHESASKILRDRVFPTMKDDSVSKVIRYDELAIDYGNKLCEKYHDPHFYDMIRQKLRQIGRLLLEMKNQNDKIDDLFTIFVPDNYDNCLKAVRNLAGLNESGTGFKTPSLATSLGTFTQTTL